MLRSCACEQDLRAYTCLKTCQTNLRSLVCGSTAPGPVVRLWLLGCSQRAEVFGGCSLDPETPVGLPQAQDTGSRLETPSFAGWRFWEHPVLHQPPSLQQPPPAVTSPAVPSPTVPPPTVPPPAAATLGRAIPAVPPPAVPPLAVPSPGRGGESRCPLAGTRPGPGAQHWDVRWSGSSPAPLRLRQPLLQPRSPRWCLGSLLDGFCFPKLVVWELLPQETSVLLTQGG